MKFVMSPAMPPTHGPARRAPSTVPIESRNKFRWSVLATACPAQSMAIQTGMRTMARVFILTLNALRMPKADPSYKAPYGSVLIRRPDAAPCQLRGTAQNRRRGHCRGAWQHQHGPGRAGARAAEARGHCARRFGANDRPCRSRLVRAVADLGLA